MEEIIIIVTGNSLVVQWLGLRFFTAVAWIQSLVGELRCMAWPKIKRKKIVTELFTISMPGSDNF